MAICPVDYCQAEDRGEVIACPRHGELSLTDRWFIASHLPSARLGAWVDLEISKARERIYRLIDQV